MRTNIKFWLDSTGARWMRMTLSGDGWPAGWGVPYSYLDSWGMLPYFKVTPVDPEGLLAGQDYAMSDVIALQSFDAFIDLLHQLVSAIKPVVAGTATFLIEDERVYVVATIEATICDQSFKALVDIIPTWESVAWRLNGIGMARFSLPYVDAACKRDYLREGNGLYLRFSEDLGLPDWGGVLDLPQDQDESGVTQSAYSGEHILTWRETGLNRIFSTTAPGMIFKGLIDDANSVVPTGITTDTIYTGGTAIDKAYHFHELFRQSQELSGDAGPDFAMIPAYNGGILSFKANWYERRGQDLRGKVYLVEGKNVSKATLSRQGNLANHIEVAGNGASWGADRYVKTSDDADARAASGYREWKEVNTSISSQATIDAHVAAKLAELAWPTNAISISVLNKKPSLFADYDVGDLVSCELFLKSAEWAYTGDIRIMAREWTPSGVELVVQEWR